MTKKKTKKWTDDVVESGVRDVMKELELLRMPTASEVKEIKGHGLNNGIARSGGFVYWANRLGLQSKPSETLFGLKYEKIVKEKLTGMGFEVELTSTKHPYDILVNEVIRVDVKAARFYEPNHCHTFNLYQGDATCDIYVAVAVVDEQISRIFVIPHKFLSVSQLSIGENSKYNKYVDRWDYFKTYDDFYRSLD